MDHAARGPRNADPRRGTGQLLTFLAELGALGGTEEVIAEAWDLAELREHYEQFIEDFPRLRPRGAPATFAAQTALVHAWRRFPFIDPDLPDDLLPPDWPRRRATSSSPTATSAGRPRRSGTSTSSPLSDASASTSPTWAGRSG